MFEFLNKKIEPPKLSGPALYIAGIFAVVGVVSNYLKDNKTLGFYLLGFSVIISITGIGIAFDKKERERTRQKVTAELPERATLLNAPDADKVFQRRGYYTLAFGVGLFIIWWWFFGPSTLAVGI